MRFEDVKVGMLVRRIDESHHSTLKVGDVGVVTGICGEQIYIDNNTQPDNYHLPCFLEPAYKLEVGCKVKIVDYADFLNGKEGILHSFSAKPIVKIDGMQYPLKASNLIVIEPAPEPTPKFKIGDKVRVIDYDCHEGIGTIHSLRDGSDKFGVGFAGEFADVIPRSRLEHVDAEPASHKTDFQAYAKQREDVGALFSYENIEKCMVLNHASKHSTKSLGTPIKSYDWANIRKEVNKMPEEDRQIVSKLAEKMKDELVGFDTKSNTVFLKKAGEVSVLKRDITVEMTDADIEKLLKSKGLDATLGEYEIERFSGANTVRIVKFKPVEKIE